MSDIGKTIKRLRKEKKLTQSELAHKLGLSFSTVSMYERGERSPNFETLEAIADYFNVTLDFLKTGVFEAEAPKAMIPIYGKIPAGAPALAEQFVEGWLPTDKPNASEYFYLRVSGTSMINAGIVDGCKVLVHCQSYADDGQIVACRLNGNEATLKRFKQQGEMILLLPENPEYEPRIVPATVFASGEAEIIGVVKEIVISV